MAQSLLYPYRWGKPIVNTFVEKYPRGTRYLAKLVDVPEMNLRHLLVLAICQGNDVNWHAIKYVIKSNEHSDPREISQIPPGDRRLLYKCLRSMGHDDYLDNVPIKK